jgi:hypothetical protein
MGGWQVTGEFRPKVSARRQAKAAQQGGFSGFYRVLNVQQVIRIACKEEI